MQSLRVAFFLLLFGNLLLFAFGRGYFGLAGGGGEAERLGSQLEPDKIRVIGKGAQPGLAEASAEACQALTGLSGDQAQRLLEWLRGRDGQLKASQRALEEATSWWVFIPPLSSKREAENKAAELKKLNLQEFFVVQDKGPNQNAISLGLFKNEQGAKDYLDTLTKKGLKSARIKAREVAGAKAVVEARGAPDKLARTLADLPAEFASAARAECAIGK